MIVSMRLSFAIYLIITFLLFNNIHTTYSSINILTLQNDIATAQNSTTTLKSTIMSSLWYRPYYNNESWTGVDDICSGRLSLHRHQLAPITVFSSHSHRHIDPMNIQSHRQDDSNQQHNNNNNNQQQQSTKQYSQKEIDAISNAYNKFWNPGPVIPPHLYTPHDLHNNTTTTTTNIINQQQNQHHFELMSANQSHHSINQPTNWKSDGSTWVFDEPPSNPVMDVINNNDNNQPKQPQQNQFEIQHRSRHNDPKLPVRVFQPLVLGQIDPEALEPDETVPNISAVIPFKHKKRLFSTQAMISNDNYIFTLQSAIEKNNNNISPIHQIKRYHHSRHNNNHEPIIPLITDENRPSTFPSPYQNNHFKSLSHEIDPNSQCLTVNTRCRIKYSTSPQLSQYNVTQDSKSPQNYRYLCHQTISNNCTYINDDLRDRIIRINDPPDNRSVQIEGYITTQPAIHSIKKTDYKVKPNIN